MIQVVGLFVVLLMPTSGSPSARIPLENFNINLYIKNIYNKIIYNNIIYKIEMSCDQTRTQDQPQKFPTNPEANFKLSAPDES